MSFRAIDSSLIKFLRRNRFYRFIFPIGKKKINYRTTKSKETLFGFFDEKRNCNAHSARGVWNASCECKYRYTSSCFDGCLLRETNREAFCSIALEIRTSRTIFRYETRTRYYFSTRIQTTRNVYMCISSIDKRGQFSIFHCAIREKGRHFSLIYRA